MASDKQFLAKKVALVTGSTRNLGLGIAHSLAAAGADIMLNFHDERRREEANSAVELLRQHGQRAAAEQADVTDAGQVSRLFEKTIDAFGGVDIVVNNAGLVVKKPLAETTDDDFDRAFAINARAAFLVMREAARKLRDGGRVVNIVTSIMGVTIPGYSVYAGSKGAVEHMTKALAKEIGSRGITVNCVAPGPLETAFYHNAETPQSYERAKTMSVAGRLGEVGDVIPLVLFLCGPEARWVTAQTLRVNGGMV